MGHLNRRRFFRRQSLRRLRHGAIRGVLDTFLVVAVSFATKSAWVRTAFIVGKEPKFEGHERIVIRSSLLDSCMHRRSWLGDCFRPLRCAPEATSLHSGGHDT